MKIYYDKDADLSLIKSKKVTIVGYGSQGHAHALNLKDSGYHVIVGLREGSPSREQAEAAGFEVYDVAEAASRGDVVMILLPDERQAQVWNEQIRDGIAEGNLLMFAHGFTIHFGEIEPPPGVDVGMVAPKGPPGTVLMFHSTLVHGSPGNMSPFDRTIVYLSLCHVENHIRRFARPEWIAHRDFTPIACLDDDCLAPLLAEAA